MNNQVKTQLAAYQAQVEEALEALLTFPPSPQHSVKEAMAYSLLGGGKRIRAVLALEFCRLCGGDPAAALPFACAIEMVHAYSLIHDDLPCMDDDDLRRGKPSCHIAFGEATALLAGDGLLTLAFQTVLGARSSLPPATILRIGQELAQAVGVDGMIGGQVMDMGGMAVDDATLRQMYGMKTGALLRASARIGCLAGGGDDGALAAATHYAERFGLSFQIMDDVLDAVGDAATLGKPIGSDEANQKTTFVTLYGHRRAKEISDSLLEEAAEGLLPLLGQKDFILGLTSLLANRNQ